MNEGFVHPETPWMIVQTAFLSISLVYFITIGALYHNVVSKKEKKDQDILKRKKYINLLSYGMAVCLSAIPFFANSWGINMLGKFDPETIASNESAISRFLLSGMEAALLLSLAVFLTDNILGRIASPILTTKEAHDLDKFCLFLRSFSMDDNKEEKLICKVTKSLYPVYAIGDPNSVLQPNGANRIYATDLEWKDTVRELSSKSKLILLRIGHTEGTQWEIDNIIKEKLVHKAIFFAYNTDDYRYLSEKIKSNSGLDTNYAGEINNSPIAFFWDTDGNFYYKAVAKKTDVERLINKYLEVTPSLDKEYEQELELRHHSLKYLFDKKRIPASIRKSLNWGIISPIVNMRHWPLLVWGLFFLSAVLRLVYVFVFFAFLFGNRIEWAVNSWSSDTMFLKAQKREARLMWFCIILGAIYSFMYIFMELLTYSVAC